MKRGAQRATPVLLTLAALAATVSTAGCDEKKKTADTSTEAGAADKYATADPKLTKALQAAASASAGADTNGPPPAGVFDPGVADKRHPKGAPTKVDVITDGTDPKVSFVGGEGGAADPRASSYGMAAMEIAQQMGQRASAPTIDYGLLLGPAKADDGGPDVLVGALKTVGLAREQAGQMPPGLDKEIANLAGSEVRVKLSADGKESDVSLVMGKNAKAELDRLAQNAGEALALATIPSPGKPVGVGAQWIAESRMPLSGVDVVAYRAFKVKSITGDRLHLTVDVKAYATDKDVDLAGVPKGATLEQFDTLAEGEMEVVRGEVLARKADLQERVVMVFAPPGGVEKAQPGQPPPQQQMMTAQIVVQATLVRGDDLKQALKHP